MAYFLIAVSNRQNLELCLTYALAGFTNSGSGLWTFVDIQEGDFVSFLYGARVFNLYEVANKFAYRDADKLPPWPPLTLQPSGITYYFPYRLGLKPVRTLDEPLVRAEFAYVAENLLLRGGYRKTHFQADQTTLQAVSEMGRPFAGDLETMSMDGAETFIPRLALDRTQVTVPEVMPFRELFLQALARRHLRLPGNLSQVLALAGVTALDAEGLEVLSEKGFPEGHVDLLIKEATPKGVSRKIIVEVKRGPAAARHIEQLNTYMQAIGEECLSGVLIAGSVSAKIRGVASQRGVTALTYSLDFPPEPATFDVLLSNFHIAV